MNRTAGYELVRRKQKIYFLVLSSENRESMRIENDCYPVFFCLSPNEGRMAVPVN